MARQLRPPEEYLPDPITGRVRLAGSYPVRHFVIGEHIRKIRGRHDYDLLDNPDYPGKPGSGAYKVAYQIQDGKGYWFALDTKQEIPADEIPAALRASVAANPPRRAGEIAQVTVGSPELDPKKQRPGETLEDWDERAREAGATLELRRSGPATPKSKKKVKVKKVATPAQLASIARARAARWAAAKAPTPPPTEQPVAVE